MRTFVGFSLITVLALQVVEFVVYPGDTNHYGTLFGGKTLAEMDRTAGIVVRQFLTKSKVKDAVTVGITDVKFHKPGLVGDLIRVDGSVVRCTEKTITVHVTCTRDAELLVEGDFTFVSYDRKEKRAVPHGLCSTSLP